MDLVAIITLNYNKSDFTFKCVSSILNSDYSHFKILLIDNGSEEVEFNKLSVLNDDRLIIRPQKKNLGYVGGINVGLKEAQKLYASYYLIMNNDTFIDKYAIKELVSTSKKYNDNCIVSGKVYNMDEPDTLQYIGNWCSNFNKLEFPSYIQRSREKDTGQYDNEMEMDMLDDIFWLLPDVVFNKVGYYSDYFYLYGEQNDYALRAIKNGVRLIYTPQAKIWHYHHLSAGAGENGFKRIHYWMSYSLLLLGFLHLSKRHFLILYTSKWIKTLVKSILALLIFQFPKFKNNYLPYLLAHFFFTIWLFRKNKNSGYNPYL